MGGCGWQLVTVCREGSHGFSHLEGTLELFHFKGAKVSLVSGLGNGFTIHEFKRTGLSLTPWGYCMGSRAIRSNIT